MRARIVSGGYTEEALDYWADESRVSKGLQPEGKLISDDQAAESGAVAISTAI